MNCSRGHRHASTSAEVLTPNDRRDRSSKRGRLVVCTEPNVRDATGWHEVKVVSQLPSADVETAHTLARHILGEGTS